MRALHVLRHEYDQDQQGQHTKVHWYGKAFPKLWRQNKKYQRPQPEGGKHPNKLLSAARAPVEDGRWLRGMD